VSNFGLKPVQAVSSDDEAEWINSLKTKGGLGMESQRTMDWLPKCINNCASRLSYRACRPIEFSSYSWLLM
jgi:hypothetical protein